MGSHFWDVVLWTYPQYRAAEKPCQTNLSIYLSILWLIWHTHCLKDSSEGDRTTISVSTFQCPIEQGMKEFSCSCWRFEEQWNDVMSTGSDSHRMHQVQHRVNRVHCSSCTSLAYARPRASFLDCVTPNGLAYLWHLTCCCRSFLVCLCWT